MLDEGEDLMENAPNQNPAPAAAPPSPSPAPVPPQPEPTELDPKDVMIAELSVHNAQLQASSKVLGKQVEDKKQALEASGQVNKKLRDQLEQAQQSVRRFRKSLVLSIAMSAIVVVALLCYTRFYLPPATQPNTAVQQPADQKESQAGSEKYKAYKLSNFDYGEAPKGTQSSKPKESKTEKEE